MFFTILSVQGDFQNFYSNDIIFFPLWKDFIIQNILALVMFFAQNISCCFFLWFSSALEVICLSSHRPLLLALREIQGLCSDELCPGAVHPTLLLKYAAAVPFCLTSPCSSSHQLYKDISQFIHSWVKPQANNGHLLVLHEHTLLPVVKWVCGHAHTSTSQYKDKRLL